MESPPPTSPTLSNSIPYPSTPAVPSPSGKQSSVHNDTVFVAVIAVIAVIFVMLIFVPVVALMIMGLSKKKAAHNDIDNPLGVPTHRRTYVKEQLANPSEHSMEVKELNGLADGIDICTYTREELAKATDNFTTKVGQGVSGFVYRASFPGNRMGAVKRATDLDPKLFKQELSVLLRLPRHPHLVDLIGLCLQEGLKSLHDDTPLAEWTQTYRSEGIDRFITIVDQNVRPHINMMELQNMIKIVNVCLAEISEERS